MKTIFISRNVNAEGILGRFCAAQDIELIAISLIDFELVSATDFPRTDVIFFTSPRSVEFYLRQAQIDSYHQLATVGKRTSQELEARGYHVDFTGSTPTHPELVAVDFKGWLGERKVLFPQSDRSNQTMQQQLNFNQYVNRVVYKTVLVSQSISPQPDVLIFSSPSNAEAYLIANTITSSQKVLAFGSTTSAFLKTKGITSQLVEGTEEDQIVVCLAKYV